MALSIGTGSALGQSARYIPAIVAFSLGALIGGRLLRGPQKLQERRIGFAVELVIIVAATALTWVSEPDAHNLAGNWRRRMTSVGLFMAGAALGGLLLQFGTVWPLVLTSVVFSLAMIPLMFGEKPQ